MDFPIQTNYTNICRTCLIENSNMKSVFSWEEIFEQKIMLCDMLMSCASILIMQGDGLPENICISCSQQINTAYLFRKLCERSDVTLRECTVFTSLSTDQNNLFAIPVNDNKFDIEEKSLAKESYLKCGTENNYQEAIVDTQNCKDELDDSNDNLQDSSEDSEEEETIAHGRESEDTPLSRRTNYSCEKCNGTNFKLLSSYREHMAKVHREVFSCEQCQKEFSTKNALSHHIISSHINSSTKSNRQRNKTGITKKRNLPRTCDICHKTFRFHSNLERHKLIHTGEKPYLCNVCGKGFAQMAYLKIHSFIHTGEKPYKCQMCERSFAAPGTLMTHVRTHTGERPHICKICGKDFPQSGYLSAHIRTHTGEKPVECKVCNRRFNQSGRLIIHMRIHSGEKPYQCKDCGRSFAVKGTLKKHIRTHTGERPYMCKVCGQTFAQSGTLATHMKVHKPKTESENLKS